MRNRGPRVVNPKRARHMKQRCRRKEFERMQNELLRTFVAYTLDSVKEKK